MQPLIFFYLLMLARYAKNRQANTFTAAGCKNNFFRFTADKLGNGLGINV
jgi:hypothetical protein